MDELLKQEQDQGLDFYEQLCRKGGAEPAQHEAQVTIQFDAEGLGRDGLKELHEIEQRLFALGIRFDTGMGMGYRDWSFDWSLKGPVRVVYRRPKDAPVRAS